MLAGVWAVRRFERWAVAHSGELIAFAAGLLVSGALLHLVGHAVELVGGEPTLYWTLLSFLVLYLVEAHFVPHVHGRGETPIDVTAARRASIGWVTVAGLAIHSVVDGFAVAAALSAGTVLGSVTLLVVVVHKMPVGIASMSALYHSGVHGTRAVATSSVLALVTPITIVLSYQLFRDLSAEVLGTLLALAGGSFLYIGAADLLPEGQARGRFTNTALFMSGAGVVALIRLIG